MLFQELLSQRWASYLPVHLCLCFWCKKRNMIHANENPLRKKKKIERREMRDGSPCDSSVNWASPSWASWWVAILAFLWVVIFLSSLSLGFGLLWLMRNDRTNTRGWWRWRTRRSRRPLHLSCVFCQQCTQKRERERERERVNKNENKG